MGSVTPLSITTFPTHCAAGFAIQSLFHLVPMQAHLGLSRAPSHLNSYHASPGQPQVSVLTGLLSPPAEHPPYALVYSAVLSSAPQATCHRRLSQPNWNVLYLLSKHVHWHFSHGNSQALFTLAPDGNFSVSAEKFHILQPKARYSLNPYAVRGCCVLKRVGRL